MVAYTIVLFFFSPSLLYLTSSKAASIRPVKPFHKQRKHRGDGVGR
jgi:hypothetical protein